MESDIRGRKPEKANTKRGTEMPRSSGGRVSEPGEPRERHVRETDRPRERRGQGEDMPPARYGSGNGRSHERRARETDRPRERRGQGDVHSQAVRVSGNRPDQSRRSANGVKNRGGSRKRPSPGAIRERTRRQSRRRRKLIVMRTLMIIVAAALTGGTVSLIVRLIRSHGTDEAGIEIIDMENVASMPQPLITEDFLPFNEYSRPGEDLPTVNKIFVHYTANPGTSAKQNRDYFAGLAQSHETSASSHFIIGIDGEIIQCLPLKEIGYAVAGRNYDTISIECCHPSEDGQFTEKTVDSLIQLSAWLLQEYRLTTDDVIRHFDENGKNCPKYYVEHEDAWTQFKQDLVDYIHTQNETV